MNATEKFYDFNCEENSTKWKGVLVPPLRKVLDQVHPSLSVNDDALNYIEGLCLRLLAMLCAKSPHTVQDVENKVQNTFPNPINQWALKDAQEALEKGKKKSVLPVDKIHNLLQKELLQYKIDSSVSLFLVAVLEYISADILKLAGNYVTNIKHTEITYQDVQISMNADKALMDLFYQDEGGKLNICEQPSVSTHVSRTTKTYEEVVRELMTAERQYLRDLHMIIKVFREEIIKLKAEKEEIEIIFSNILDIYELTVTLLGSLEDVIEMAQDQMPFIGSCFEELVEAKEFDVYIQYAADVTSSKCRETLNGLLGKPQIQNLLLSAGQGMRLSLKYYLPALLQSPIFHCFAYLDYVRQLCELSKLPDDKETLIEVEGQLNPLISELGRYASAKTVVRQPQNQILRSRREQAISKIHELEKMVENWDSKDLGQCCNEFVREDMLMKVSSGKRLTERRVFLFDGLLILCKPNPRRQSSVHGNHHHDCRLKERFFIRMVEIVDLPDTEDLKNVFEICPRGQPPIVLSCKNGDDKNSWLADLVMLNNRSMLERILDSILSDIERKHPLKLPSPEIYKFAEPDSKDNIVLEQRENGGGVPLIKGATIYKLVERLTYHIYADPKFVKTFLTTYRSFCAPTELLKLLIERFHIPDPSLVYEQESTGNDNSDKMQKNSQREDWKRYRKEYVQPVQFRVLNVLRHWVDHHFYDFERDPALLAELEKFLDSVNGKSMRKWVDSVVKIVQRKLEPDAQRLIKFNFDDQAPNIEWHLTQNEEDFGILTLHPLEIARQLTILDFDLYRTIKPSELVGCVWTKKDKEKTSPNLLRMIKHTNNLTLWYEKNIVEAENFEERVAIVNRIIEIMTYLDELNNFNAVLAIVSAMGSASVHRLKFTYQSISQTNRKALEECRAADNHFKKYQEKLRSINPPCVPFLGMYLTNIFLLEEGNQDFIQDTQLINFFKRRKVAEITGEIQQYQNQPYAYKVEPKIRKFLENLSPFGEMSDNEISNYLFNKSIEIEPRGSKQVPKFPRKWPHLSLKSPGTKASNRRIKELANITATTTAIVNSTVQKIEEKIVDGGEEKKSADKTDNSDISVFAPVQIPTAGCQSSPTLSPNSPAATSFPPFTHSRHPSICSVTSQFTHRTSISSNSQPLPPKNSTGSPGPHSPASPGPHFPLSAISGEPISPHIPSTPPPVPPRRRRDSPEISSPQQLKQAPDAPTLPPRDISPPPLPPRIGSGTLPRLTPTHLSQLHIRRHSTMHHPNAPRQINGGTPIAQAKSVSPRFVNETSPGHGTPKLPPKPAIKSAGLASGTVFQYPSTTTSTATQSCFRYDFKD
nr:protein son of sevenless isoform X2 [Onthophagus taurus]